MSPTTGDDPELARLRGMIADLERQLSVQKRTEQWLRARDAATGILVSASSFNDAAPQLLEGIGHALGWDHGYLWKVEPRWSVLRCIATWRESPEGRSEFEELTKRRTFQRESDCPAGCGQAR